VWNFLLSIAYWLPGSMSVGAVLLLFGWGLLKAIQNKFVGEYLLLLFGWGYILGLLLFIFLN